MSIEFANREGQSNAPLADLPRLLSRFFDQVLELLNTQFALLKAEVSDAAGDYGRRVAITAFAALVALLGFALLNVGLALWLGPMLGNTSLAFAALGFIYLVGGGVVAQQALRRLKTPPAFLKDTRKQLERDKQWVKTQTT